MTIQRRVYVSLPADPWLPDNLNTLKWGIVDEIAKLGCTPEIFTNPRGHVGLASALSWHPREADAIARRCVAAVVIGMARWTFVDPATGQPVRLPTEFNHYEGALARTLRLPTLVLAQQDVLRRVVFDMNFAGFVGEFAPDADLRWLHTPGFTVPFGYWRAALAQRRDLFLGYSSRSQAAAAAIKQFLEAQGVRVLDWQTDFIPGSSILEQIDEAAARSIGGIFLFGRDDVIDTTALPRDNVVFEAGYFVGQKGKRNVLIVREAGSKMPADLGGDIYAALPARGKKEQAPDITPIQPALLAFVRAI